MKCLVCDNDIRVDTLNQLFSLQPLKLCGRCSPNLRPKSKEVLFEDNEWIRAVIDKLNQGDIALVQLFENSLRKALIRKKIVDSKLKIIESRDDLPYPWLEILVNRVLNDSKKETSVSSNAEFAIGVVKEENANLGISLIG